MVQQRDPPGFDAPQQQVIQLYTEVLKGFLLRPDRSTLDEDRDTTSHLLLEEKLFSNATSAFFEVAVEGAIDDEGDFDIVLEEVSTGDDIATITIEDPPGSPGPPGDTVTNERLRSSDILSDLRSRTGSELKVLWVPADSPKFFYNLDAYSPRLIINY